MRRLGDLPVLKHLHQRHSLTQQSVAFPQLANDLLRGMVASLHIVLLAQTGNCGLTMQLDLTAWIWSFLMLGMDCESVLSLVAEYRVPDQTLYRWKSQAWTDAGLTEGVISTENKALLDAHRLIKKAEQELARVKAASEIFAAEVRG